MERESEFSVDEDDFSNRFASISSTLANSNGVRYPEFRRTLSPRYAIVWLHISLAYALIAAVVAGLIWVAGQPLPVRIGAAVVGGTAIGYTVAYLSLFMHEAAHFNLSADRRRNDRLANVFVGLITGTDICAYRPVHFDHHRNLGLPEDSEKFYTLPLGMRLLLESLMGISLLKAVLNRLRPKAVGVPRKKEGGPWVTLTGAALHALLLGWAVYTAHYELAAGWLFGLAVVWPFLAVLRPILEHRSEQASAATDYAAVPHGAVTRIFGDGALDSTLGGAGFNRHLIHHWEPQVSYTRLSDLEAFLLDTQIAPVLRRRRTSYVRTFYLLFGK